MAVRLEKLFAKWRAGTLPKPRASRAGEKRKPPSKPRLRFPSARGWLANFGYDFRGRGAQIAYQFANDPDFPAFIAACPQAGRIIRPLCHMLRLDVPEPIRREPKPRKPRAKRPPREKPEPFRVPIPPGARAWMPKKPRRRRSSTP